jgi:hypothetical protein
MNLAEQFNPCTKESQLFNKSQKLSQKQLGDISQKVDKEVKERSGGICERCRSARATERAHLIGRKQIKHKTTAKDIWHLCTPCHDWLDETPEGIQYKRSLKEGA